MPVQDGVRPVGRIQVDALFGPDSNLVPLPPTTMLQQNILAAVTTVTFTLPASINKFMVFDIAFSLLNSVPAAAGSVFIAVNGADAATNWTRQQISATSGGVLATSETFQDRLIAAYGAAAGSFTPFLGKMIFKPASNGKTMSINGQFYNHPNVPGGATGFYINTFRITNFIETITDISFTASTANAIGVGSFFQISYIP